jgi:hypothetical protein
MSMKECSSMLRRFKWRIILSLTNLLAALAQSALGLNEAEAFLKANPPHDNVLPYIPIAQLISYSLNAPALVVTNLVGRVPAWRAFWRGQWLGGYCFYDVSTSFYVALFLLWWWVGWRLDMKSKQSDKKRMVAILGDSLGVLLSLMLLYIAADLLLTELPSLRFAGGPAIPISVLIWGIGLLTYFSVAITRAEIVSSQNSVRS